MKRTADAAARDAPSSKAPKRHKSSLACANCRRQKTRCEQLDSGGTAGCHRCKVLTVQCSFLPENNPTPVALFQRALNPPRSTLPGNYQDVNDLADKMASLPSKTSFSELDADGFFDILHMLPKPVIPWGFTKIPDFDWTAQPILAIGELAHRPIGPHTRISLQGENDALIITAEKVHYLLDVWEAKYAAWTLLPPDQNQPEDTPLYTLARCAVACRHLDPASRAGISPALQRKVRTEIIDRIFFALPSVDLIKAFYCLSLWTPVDGEEAADGRLVLGAAVSAAMNLNLSQAAIYATTLQEKSTRESGLSPEDQGELEDALTKARLWLALSVAEAMVCLGTGRRPIAKRSLTDVKILPPNSTDTIAAGRDTRLRLLSQMVDLAEQGHAVRLKGPDDMERWHKEVLQVMMGMDSLSRLIAPLLTSCKYEAFHFQMLKVYQQAYRFLIMHHSIRHLRHAFLNVQTDSPTSWFHKTNLNGVNLAETWCQEALQSVEGVLVHTMATGTSGNLNLLSAAPDNLYVQITFAAAMMVMAKFAMQQGSGHASPPSADHALIRVSADCLEQVSLGPGHMSAKCGRLIRAFWTSYDNARTAMRNGTPMGRHSSRSPKATVSPSMASEPPTPDPLISSPSPFHSHIPLSTHYELRTHSLLQETAPLHIQNTSFTEPAPTPAVSYAPPPQEGSTQTYDYSYGMDLGQLVGGDELFGDADFWTRDMGPGYSETSAYLANQCAGPSQVLDIELYTTFT